MIATRRQIATDTRTRVLNANACEIRVAFRSGTIRNRSVTGGPRHQYTQQNYNITNPLQHKMPNLQVSRNKESNQQKLIHFIPKLSLIYLLYATKYTVTSRLYQL